MFNIGFTELIILAVIGLLVIGPEQLPDLARKLAKMLNELKRAKDEIFSPVEEMKQEARFALEKMRKNLDQQLGEEALMKPSTSKLTVEESEVQLKNKDQSKESNDE